MTLKGPTPMLRTANITDSIDFYVHVLGFEVENYDKGLGWASLVKDKSRLMLALPNEHGAFTVPEFTGSFYFNTDNVDEWWQQAKDKARVCYPVEDFDYGMREFAVFDNNGYLLQFGQPINP